MVYTKDPEAYTNFVSTLKQKSDEQIYDLIKHVRDDQHNHPDDEFWEFRLEGELTDDEVMDALFAEYDERMSKKRTKVA